MQRATNQAGGCPQSSHVRTYKENKKVVTSGNIEGKKQNEGLDHNGSAELHITYPEIDGD